MLLTKILGFFKSCSLAFTASTALYKSRIPYLLAIFLSLLLIVPMIDFGVNYLYAPKIEQEAYNNLRLIAKIKVVQYERWLEARKGDADVLVADRNLAELVQTFQSNASGESRNRILERFDSLISAYDYEGISLLNLQGDEIIHRGMTNASDAVKWFLMQQARATSNAVNSDLYLTGNNQIQLDVIAPVLLRQGAQTQLIGYIIIHTGIHKLILPRVLSWPSASSSAEVLIVSTDGHTESIISASRRDKKQAVISMRALDRHSPYNPVSEYQQGQDYQGKLVYTVKEPLSNSAWGIVTQIDQKEVAAPLTTLLLWVSLISLAAVSLVALALIILWYQQRRTHELQLIADSSERDHLLKRFYDLPFIGMGIATPATGLWTQVNDRLCEILGYTRTELLQLNYNEITHPEDVAADQDSYAKFENKEIEYYQREKRLLQKNGKEVIARVEVSCVYTLTGKIEMLLIAVEDITERKLAEEALRMQEEFNRVLLENQADSVIACDANMQLALLNHTARAWHGLDSIHIPAEQWARHFGLYDADGENELTPEQIPLVRAFNGEHLQHEGMAIKAKGQETRYVSCSAAPFFDVEGKKLGAVAIMRDVTAARRHSEALQASEALYREMFDANPHPMWVFDVKTLEFLAVNDAAINHYGWSRAEFLSMKISAIRPEQDVSRLNEHIPDLMQDNTRTPGEWQHRKMDGSIIDVEITSHALEFNGREARLVLAYDITERKRNESEVRLLNRLLLMLTNISQVIIQRLDPIDLFNEACTIAVRDGGFRMAWIGLVDEESGMLKDVGSAGMLWDYVESLKFNMNDPSSKDGPSPRAIREGKHAVCQDITTDESIAPWRAQALLNGYRSMIALPLRKFGKVVGNFSLYASDSAIFNQRELDLLDELAGDISFALEVVEAEQERQAALKALQESEALFHTLASASPVGILHTDAQGKLLYVNECCYHMSGLSSNQMALDDWARVTHPDDRKRVQAVWKKTVQEQCGFSMEYRFQRPDNSIIWVQGQAEPERDANGKVLGFVGTITDISAIKASEEKLRMSAAVFENTREGIMVTDAENRIVMVNKAFTDITRYNETEVLGKSPKMLSSGRHDRSFYNGMWQSLQEVGHWQEEVWNRRKNGDIHPVLMTINAICDEANNIINYVAVFADISNLKASEAQLEFLAHHDPLTRLPNRLMLISQLGHAIEVARRDKGQLALLMLDLDRFKNVNDSFGHLAGDELLQLVAKRLSEKLRGVDTITRLGGDEFTVLLEDLTNPEDAVRVADNIIVALEVPCTLSNNIEVRISASIGISLYPGHGTTALELLQHADAALYQAKAAGRGCARYFSESLTKAARDRFNTEARLRLAIQNEELRVYYQPKIDMASGQIIGAEALLRWMDPVDGLILPMYFISIAEETGLIGPIGEWVMLQTCRQGKRWLDEGLLPLSLAVNLSANQLHHSDIVETVGKVLDETGFPTHLLELELTESILMQREDEIVETLSALRARGVRLAIDDFGTGYSSLAYLKSFPLDVLKIDRSFVTDIEEDADDRAITATIIGIAHTLGLQVVAEGVETQHQLEFLRNQGCDMYQGFIVSQPLPAEEFVQFLRAYNKASVETNVENVQLVSKSIANA
jgi:diguanylate cyclase (GGDEF)-like protein/PAS domain S-box-containing protein